MNVLALGAAGSVGQTIIMALEQDESYSLTAGVRKKVEWLPVMQREIDLLDDDSIEQIIDESKPDLVINSAGLVGIDECEDDPDLAYALNVTAVETLLKSLPSYSRLIQISTQAIFPGTDGEYKEDHSIEDFAPTIYGETKRLGELVLKDTGANIIRLTNFYGIPPYHETNKESQPSFMLNKMRIEGYEANSRRWNNPVFNEDLILLWHTIVLGEDVGTLHVGGAGSITDYQFSKKISEAVGFEGKLIETRENDRLRPGLDIGKLLDLGITPRDPEQGIKAFAKQYKIE